MLRIERIQGKSIKEWAAADLPHGAFTAMAREVDPFWGIYAEAGAQKRRYRVRRTSRASYGPEMIVQAFNKEHACAIAYDEHGWLRGETRAFLIEEQV